MMKNVCVVIPAKNEEVGIAKVIEDLHSAGLTEILVVDGSTDKTASVASSLGARVVHEERRGYGRAYKTGFAELGPDVEFVATLDADGTYPANLIPSMVSMLSDSKLDFISCARDYKSVMCFKHKVGNFVLTLTANVLYGTSVRDSQSGMWVFRKSCLDNLQLESDGMGFSQEIKYLAIRAGLRFREVTVPYGERIGEVKLDGTVDGIKNLLYLFKMRFR